MGNSLALRLLLEAKFHFNSPTGIAMSLLRVSPLHGWCMHFVGLMYQLICSWNNYLGWKSLQHAYVLAKVVQDYPAIGPYFPYFPWLKCGRSCSCPGRALLYPWEEERAWCWSHGMCGSERVCMAGRGRRAAVAGASSGQMTEFFWQRGWREMSLIEPCSELPMQLSSAASRTFVQYLTWVLGYVWRDIAFAVSVAFDMIVWICFLTCAVKLTANDDMRLVQNSDKELFSI